ncbi:MAG: asparagine synthase (glutamine-hydrolyzing) [Mesorhizobium sp.]
MSGIVGIFANEAGRPDLSDATGRMLAAIAHRGPDGFFQWHDDNAAIGHAWLNTTGENGLAVLKFADADLAIVADVRLDNRDELLAGLGIRDQGTPDVLLIMKSYVKWGEDCASRLLGDFAFGIWDSERRLLFCARDHFGAKPFYYVRDNSGFSFASEIKALVALGSVEFAVDDSHVSAFLAGMAQDVQETAYSNVRRLPPGHTLTATRHGFRVGRYWKVEPGRPRPGNDHTEEFRHLFQASVENRMRGSTALGSMLSGGLDSSSICCVASARIAKDNGPGLRTFSAVFPKLKELDERRYIDAVLDRGGYTPHFVTIDEEASFEGFDRVLAEQEGTFNAPGLAVIRRVYRAAADEGIRVLLDGHGGDEVVSHGDRRIHELAVDGQWLTLWQELRGLSRLYGGPSLKPYLKLFNHYALSESITRFRGSARIFRHHGRRNTQGMDTWRTYLKPDFVSRTGLLERFSASIRIPPGARSNEANYHRWKLSAPLVSHAFEVLGKSAAAVGIEPRYPFWDKRLVEFCLALPSDQKLSDGWSRLVLRRAMEGILPAEVQWRHDKTDFMANLVRGMTNQRRLIEGMLTDTHGLASYVKVDAVAEAFQQMVADPQASHGYQAQFLWRVVSLAHWLRQAHPTVVYQS